MQRSRAIVGLVFLIFFVISFLTNILGPLVPDIISAFSLSLTLAGFLPFSFFVAYGVMSIPAGTLVERRGERVVMAASFAAACAGATLFALVPSYRIAIGSLFLIGLGMAALQVAINPLLRVAGGEEHFAFYSVFAQLVFGLASFLSPRAYTYLVQGLQADPTRNWLLAALSRVVPKELPWVSLYWVFALVTLVMVVVIASVRLPRVELKEDERAGALATYLGLLRQRVVVLYFFGIFAYVGSEQGIANWISEFLRSYHGFDPTTTGASAVSWFWGLMTAGCLLGMGLPQALRQPARPARLRRRRHRDAHRGPLRPGPGLPLRLSRPRLLPLRDVVDRLLARPQLPAPPPRCLLRHPLHGDRRRRGRAPARRLAGRPARRPARRDAGGLRDPRLRLQRGGLGAAPDRERDDLASEEGRER